MPSVQKCIITIDKKRYPVADIGYTVNDDALRIFVTPKQGVLPTDAVQVHPSGFVYDLIVTINVSELPSAGAAYEDHKSLFQTVPIINIDHRADNEQFGQINWIDIKSTSTSELIYSLMNNGAGVDAATATNLLAGIMEETHSFRTPQVTPNTLQTVSALLKAGAAHASVTQHLYRNKTVGGLKLWGHVLTHLQSDRQLSLAWSLVPASLFTTTGTTVSQLQDLMIEILSHSPEARTVVLFIEHAPHQVEVQVTAKSPLHAKDLIKDWQPRGSERFAQANINGKALVDVEQEVIAVVKKRLASVLGA
jgi:phosphoesterase RecJ-like protein